MINDGVDMTRFMMVNDGVGMTRWLMIVGDAYR